MVKVYFSEYVNENNLTVVVKMFPVHIKRLVLNPLSCCCNLVYQLVKDRIVEWVILPGGIGITCASIDNIYYFLQ